jgi:hypothetical protein
MDSRTLRLVQRAVDTPFKTFSPYTPER